MLPSSCNHWKHQVIFFPLLFCQEYHYSKFPWSIMTSFWGSLHYNLNFVSVEQRPIWGQQTVRVWVVGSWNCYNCFDICTPQDIWGITAVLINWHIRCAFISQEDCRLLHSIDLCLVIWVIAVDTTLPTIEYLTWKLGLFM